LVVSIATAVTTSPVQVNGRPPLVSRPSAQHGAIPIGSPNRNWGHGS
jgi:hypothetical protein